MNDRQKLLAFNDSFISPSSHISARYRITHKDKTENHSSSRIIILQVQARLLVKLADKYYL